MKVIKSLVRDFLYADDCAIIAHLEDDIKDLQILCLQPLSALDSQ